MNATAHALAWFFAQQLPPDYAYGLLERLGTVAAIVVVLAFMLRYFMKGYERQLQLSREDARMYQESIERITDKFATNIDANTKATQESIAATKESAAASRALRDEIIRAGKVIITPGSHNPEH